MRSPATYLPPRALIRRTDALAAIARAVADAQQQARAQHYRWLLERAIRNASLPQNIPTQQL